MAIKLEKAKGVISRDRKVILTTTRVPYPFVADRIEGEYAFDVDGNRFIDFTSFIAVYNFGDGPSAAVRNALASQSQKVMHSSFNDFYGSVQVDYAEKLIGMFPKGFGKLFFSNSGTEANEAALKFSKIFTKRQYTLAFYNSFHGRTMGSLGLTTSMSKQREHFGPFNSVVHAPYAYCYRCPFGKEYPSCGMACLDHIKKYTFGKEVPAKEVGAVFMEPVQGEGGYVVPPKEFVKGIREIADENGILLVADEVQAGFMRTGKFLGLDNFGVEADIYTLAKAIGGGLPMGVTVTRSSLGDIPEGSHSNTFGGNAASVAVAGATLDYVKKNMSMLMSASKSNGALMTKRLNEMKERYEIVGDVRGIGMMMAVELVKDKKTKEPAEKECGEVLKRAFENGLILLPAGASTIRLIPPITIQRGALQKGLDVLEDAIKKVNARMK